MSRVCLTVEMHGLVHGRAVDALADDGAVPKRLAWFCAASWGHYSNPRANTAAEPLSNLPYGRYTATWHPARLHAMVIEKRRKQWGWRMSKPGTGLSATTESFSHTSLQADAACGHAEVKDLATRARLFAAFVVCVAYAIWCFALS